jgi:hypothetical protein
MLSDGMGSTKGKGIRPFVSDRFQLLLLKFLVFSSRQKAFQFYLPTSSVTHTFWATDFLKNGNKNGDTTYTTYDV